MKNEKLTFTCGEGGEAEEFFVVEQTRLNGVTYLLVADSEEDDAECLIFWRMWRLKCRRNCQKNISDR